MNWKVIALVVFAVLFSAFMIGYLNSKPKWSAYPAGIIVDTPEEFNRKNTP